jgi:hypothetical protein
LIGILEAATMRIRVKGLFIALIATGLSPQVAQACHTCKRVPCVIAAPQPAYQCVTDMVPYTVTRPRTRVDFVPVTKTIMVKEPIRQEVQYQRAICKPVFDTVVVPRTRQVCRIEYDTILVNKQVVQCRPVTTTRQVTQICMQPSTQLITVPVKGHCGLCGKNPCGGTCKTVAQTCYTPVPVTRDIVETSMVREVINTQVPVKQGRTVWDTVTENVKFTTCRMTTELITEKKLVTVGFQCVPKTITRQVPVKSCEMVTETCYKPVRRMVPIAYAAAAPVVAPSSQVTPAAQAVTPAPQQ